MKIFVPSILALALLAGLSFAQSRPQRMGVNGSAGDGVTLGTDQTISGVKTFSNGLSAAGSTFTGSTSFTGGSNVTMTGNGVLTVGSGSTNLGRIQNAIGSATASATVAAIELRHTNGALDATDLVLSVLNSASNILLGVAQSGIVLSYGGHQLNTALATEPTCNAAARGTIWYTGSAGGVADRMQVCAKSSADAYAWRSMATIP